MEKIVESHLKKLQQKYQTETDIHDEVARKIYGRLAQYWSKGQQDLMTVKDIVLQSIEETYQRMVDTKRSLRSARGSLQKIQTIMVGNIQAFLTLKNQVDLLKFAAFQTKNHLVGAQSSALSAVGGRILSAVAKETRQNWNSFGKN